jgi:hypothetical protein
LKHGHAFSYGALFLFTLILYARPAEFYPSRLTASIALLVGIATLGFFIPTQLSLEGTLTARPREVNLVLLFCLAGLLSIPLAINQQEAWAEFSGTFIRCIVIFIVMVNVVRTEARLKGLLFLAMAAGIWLSTEAINDYRLGLMTIEGYRAAGRGTGVFGNTNDMALHHVASEALKPSRASCRSNWASGGGRAFCAFFPNPRKRCGGFSICQTSRLKFWRTRPMAAGLRARIWRGSCGSTARKSSICTS